MKFDSQRQNSHERSCQNEKSSGRNNIHHPLASLGPTAKCVARVLRDSFRLCCG